MSCSNKFHILEIQDLSISFRQYEKGIRQVDLPVISRLNVTVHEGEIVAVVGSSGSGKSLLAHAILGLLPSNAMCSGEFFFLQEPLTPERMEKLRIKPPCLSVCGRNTIREKQTPDDAAHHPGSCLCSGPQTGRGSLTWLPRRCRQTELRGRRASTRSGSQRRT